MRWLWLALLLPGCVNADRRYTNGESDAWCSGTAFGLIATIVTAVEVSKCSDRYLAMGYWEVSR